jgi:uncharacterized protein YjbJ (UPF0337 family)
MYPDRPQTVHQSSSSSYPNPQIDRLGKPPPPQSPAPVQHFNIADNDETIPMNLQQQKAADMDYQTMQTKEKAQANTSHVRGLLEQLERTKPRIAIKLATMGQDQVAQRILTMAQTNARTRRVDYFRNKQVDDVNKRIKEAQNNELEALIAQQQAKARAVAEETTRARANKRESVNNESKLRDELKTNKKQDIKAILDKEPKSPKKEEEISSPSPPPPPVPPPAPNREKVKGKSKKVAVKALVKRNIAIKVKKPEPESITSTIKKMAGKAINDVIVNLKGKAKNAVGAVRNRISDNSRFIKTKGANIIESVARNIQKQGVGNTLASVAKEAQKQIKSYVGNRQRKALRPVPY